jgi:hypothetical protein
MNMELSREQVQTRYVKRLGRLLNKTSNPRSDGSPRDMSPNSFTRFLAIILPALTLSTHLLLSLSLALPGDEQAWAFWSLSYNGLAALASVLGLIGAVRVSSSPHTTIHYTFTRSHSKWSRNHYKITNPPVVIA